MFVVLYCERCVSGAVEGSSGEEVRSLGRRSSRKVCQAFDASGRFTLLMQTNLRSLKANKTCKERGQV